MTHTLKRQRSATSAITEPTDIVTQALQALQQATPAQRLEIFQRFGPEATLNILADLEVAALSAAADQPSLPL